MIIEPLHHSLLVRAIRAVCTGCDPYLNSILTLRESYPLATEIVDAAASRVVPSVLGVLVLMDDVRDWAKARVRSGVARVRAAVRAQRPPRH